MTFGESKMNPFYSTLLTDSFGEQQRSSSSRKKFAVVLETGQVTFDKKIVQKWLNVPPSNGKSDDTIATVISKELNRLLSTPGEKATFAYANVEPWEQSQPLRCYSNVTTFCRSLPNEYEPLYVYSIWDRGTYYELEPHALVKNKSTGVAKDITPTMEVLVGAPSLAKICYVHHSTLEQLLILANSFRLQYGFIVVKKVNA